MQNHKDGSDVVLSREMQQFNITPTIDNDRQRLLHQFRQDFQRVSSVKDTFNVVILISHMLMKLLSLSNMLAVLN